MEWEERRAIMIMKIMSDKPKGSTDSTHNGGVGYLDTIAQYIDAHVRYYRMIPTVAGLVGVGLFLWYSKLPLRRLRQVSDIPAELIVARRRLTGVVMATSWNTIGVWHVPMWRWGMCWGTRPPENCSPNELLTVQFSGVAIGNHGSTWLREKLLGKKVWLKPLDRSSLAARDQKAIQCIVHVRNKKLFPWRRKSVNEELLASGVGYLEEGSAEKSNCAHFVALLQKSELMAKGKGKGVWNGTEFVTRWNRLKNYIKK